MDLLLYNDKDENGNGCDWILSWYNPWDRVVDRNNVSIRSSVIGFIIVVFLLLFMHI